MRPTMSLSWTSLVSKIHPPLPMSPRESARLLALLNSSFKHQLDRQHSAFLPDSKHHTTNHLRSILTNPLFDDRGGSRGMRSKDKPFGRLQDLVKKPMDVFREQVSAGTATLQTACLCLQAQYNSCLASPDNTLTNAMRASRAGTTVLEWLWSSGMEESRRFFGTREPFELLVPFLVAERQHDRILQWLRRFYAEASRDWAPEIGWRYRNLLFDFIKAELSLGKGLESATAFFIEVARGAQDSEFGCNKLNGAFTLVAYYLTTRLIAVPKSAELQISTLEPFINLSKSFSTTKRPTCLAALQALYLARNPSPREALLYFQGFSPKKIEELTLERRSRIINMGLKTAELCLDLNRQAEALHIMDFLQSNFRSEIVSHRIPDHNKKNKGSSDKAEDQSLHLLNSLAIA